MVRYINNINGAINNMTLLKQLASGKTTLLGKEVGILVMLRNSAIGWNNAKDNMIYRKKIFK